MTAIPDYVVSTGDFIAEWMEDAGINAAELARRLDVTRKHVSELLSGKAPLSHSVALGLERVTGVPARIWNQYESGYRSDLARIQERAELEAQYEQAKAFPISYLRKYGYIVAAANDRCGIVSELLAILGVADLRAFEATWVDSKVSYRKVAVRGATSPAMAIWLALGERHEAAQGDIPPYDRTALEALVPRLRALTAASDPVAAISEATALLRSVGVVFCLIPPIPALGVHGATRWVGGRPLIQLSLRGKSDDQLWFTLFHELGHVLLHPDTTVFLSSDDTDAEAEADDFASRTFVPANYRDRLPRQRNLDEVRKLAYELGIAPSIVLGQAQRMTTDYGWGHALKVKFDWSPAPRRN
ncbi:ImmA/IrrE family metallo-endopeptidase [Nocardia jiangxiensis]|uniref:ImmA/IrrE family metallo-endopeptidase n=1 Tax=Nocardia jiangxiensis TaxID=282685 RepID=A0ABW6S7C1_9NOCA